MPKKSGNNPNKSKKDGRVGRLDFATLSYYRRVSETIKDGFEDEDERGLFIHNVFTQLSEEVVKVSQNQTASSIIETLLNLASPDQLLRVAGPMSSDWETCCCDRFASHVTQTLVMSIGKLIYSRNASAGSSDYASTMSELTSHLASLWSFMQTSLGLYMQHTYASHVLRALIEVTGGVQVSESVVRSRLSKSFKDNKKEIPVIDGAFKPSEDNLKQLKQLSSEILNFARLRDYLVHLSSSPVLQTLLLVLQKRLPETAEDLCNGFIPYCFHIDDEDESTSALIMDNIGSRLAEQIISVASEDTFSSIFEKHVQGNIVKLALHSTANFVLQKVIAVCHTKEQFDTIYKELQNIIEDLLAHNHLGVIVKLVEGSITHGTKQEKILKLLMKAFHCYKPAERQSKLIALVASLTTYDVFYKLPDEVKDDKKSDQSNSSDESEGESDDEFKQPTLKEINLHGSILVQKLLQFGNPKLVVSSLLELKQTELVFLSCHPYGSHVIEAFVTSKTVGEKSRENLYKKLKGCYLNIACSKNGSRTMDTLWGSALLKQKISIAEDLIKHEAQLKGDRFGYFIWRNFALQHFLQRRPEWNNLQTGAIRKRKLFQDLICSEKETKMEYPEESNEDDTARCLPLKDEIKEHSQVIKAKQSTFTAKQEMVHTLKKTDKKTKKKKPEKEKHKAGKIHKKKQEMYHLKDSALNKLLHDIQPKP